MVGYADPSPNANPSPNTLALSLILTLPLTRLVGARGGRRRGTHTARRGARGKPVFCRDPNLNPTPYTYPYPYPYPYPDPYP